MKICNYYIIKSKDLSSLLLSYEEMLDYLDTLACLSEPTEEYTTLINNAKEALSHF